MTYSEHLDTLLQRVTELVLAGRTGAARPVLMAARQVLEPSPRLAEISGILEIRDGNLSAAQEVLDAGIAELPGHSGLHKLRAGLKLLQHDLTGALSDAAESVILNAADPGGKALLGMLLLQVGKVPDAVLCLREAMLAMPENTNVYIALAAAEDAQGHTDAAIATLNNGVRAAPASVTLRNETILLAIRHQEYLQATEMAQRTRRAGIADACTFGLLGHALSSLGRHEEAGEAYQEALKLGPDDAYVRHLAMASGVMAVSPRAPDDYVRTVFDGYADHFESHLISLGYRVPGLLRSEVLRHLPHVAANVPVGPILDLGCGTGLVGVALSDLPLQYWVGVDISPRMLALAKEKHLYSELHVEELCVFLAQEDRKFPLILAADVLCYFGDLETPLSAMASVLAPGGLIMLTVEALAEEADGGAWALGRQGRYAHRRDALLASAARVGLELCEIRAESLRGEAGSSVSGFIVVLRHFS